MSEKVRLGYKQTEVGMIPEEWEIRLLTDICRFKSGKAHEQFIVDSGDYVCVNSKFISSEGKVRKYSSLNLSPAKAGDILMVMSDLPNGKALAKAYIVKEGENLAVNQRVCSLTPYNSSSEYLFYILNRNPYFLSFNDGVNQTHLLNRVFQNCLLPLPPLPEQSAIASALADVDALLDSLEELLIKKRQLKQAAMQELLTGKTRLEGFEDEWEEKRLGELLCIRHGRNQREVESDSGAFPILATGGQIGTATSYLYDKPSVLIGRKGTINNPQYIEKPFWTVDTLFYSEILKPNNAKYLYYAFKIIDWMQFNEASGVPSLNARTIENVEISCPSSTEQKAIAAILSEMDAELEVLEERLSKTRDLKQGMMQELLTGRTRLI